MSERKALLQRFVHGIQVRRRPAPLAAYDHASWRRCPMAANAHRKEITRMGIDPALAYEQAKNSLTDLVSGCSAAELDAMVPACPLWTVGDVMRHLTGVARDMAEGTMALHVDPVESWHTAAGAQAGDEFTDNHVRTRRNHPLPAVLEEWSVITAALLPILRGERAAPQPVPFIEVVPVTDIGVHLQDVRGALGQPGDRDCLALRIGLASYAVGTGMRLSARGLPALRIRYDGRERVVGDGEPAATWSGGRFEVYRALAGRRSTAQILAMEWEGDPTPFVRLIPAYGERRDDLVE